ncbi:MAG: hypothetical protein ACFBSG_06570 [Leptolyngbyaceae cyanobacterium]
MEKPTKFDVLMAAINQLQSKLDDIDGRLNRLERPASTPDPMDNGRQSTDFEPRHEIFVQEPRKRRFSED